MKLPTLQENAVSTKIRAMFGQMLTPAQYNDLLHCHSIPQICAYLKEKTSYRDALAGAQESTIHRGQLENLLRKDTFYQYIKLIRYVPLGNGIYRYILFQAEISIILSCIRNIISGSRQEFIAEIPAFIQPYIHLHLSDFARAETLEQLAHTLNKTRYEQIIRRCIHVQSQQDSLGQYENFETAFRIFYFETILELIRNSTHGVAKKQLERLVQIRSAMINISRIYRLKQFYQMPPDEIKKMILPFYDRLTPKIMTDLIQSSDADSFLTRLRKTYIGAYMQENSDDASQQIEQMLHRMQLRLIRFSSNPKVLFMAFMSLRQMETDNIIRIIEGIRYGLAPEQIMGLLYQ